MKKFNAFLKRKDIELSWKRYFIDALGAMAQGLFCSLLIGTIVDTIGDLTKIDFFVNQNTKEKNNSIKICSNSNPSIKHTI